MVLFNYSTKELTAKIVYYGPGLCGKTTNLQYVFENLPPGIHKGRMLSLATKTDRTLFFDFLPIDLGTIRGMRTRLQLYTVPGQVFYNTTRKLVLKGADGVVFVADSQKKMLEANIESFSNLEQNLSEHGMKLSEMPHILQFNKRDLPGIASAEDLNAALNRYNAPIYEAVATTGIGVQDTLKAVTRLVLNSLKEKYGDSRKGERQPAAVAAAPVAASIAVSASPVAAEPIEIAEAPAGAVEVIPLEEGVAESGESAAAIEIAEEPAIEVEVEPVEEEAAEAAPALEIELEEPVLAVLEAEPEPVVADFVEESPLVIEEGEAESGPSALPAAEDSGRLESVLAEPEQPAPSLQEVSQARSVPEAESPEPAPPEEEIAVEMEPPEEPVEEVAPVPIEVAEAEPYELETAAAETPAAAPSGATPTISQRLAASVEAAVVAASSVSAETRAIASAVQEGADEGAREASFPIVVDIQGQALHLLVTVTIRVEKR